MKILLVLFTCVFTALRLLAQVNHTFSTAMATYTPVVAGINPPLTTPYEFYGPADEGYANDVAIGFPFVYNGITYTSVNINVNGFMTLGAGFEEDADETYYENDLTSGDMLYPGIRPIIAPLWDDHNLVNESNLRHIITGVAPNRVFTVEWANVRWSFEAEDASISFQAKLYESSNIIEFNYRRESGGTSEASASIGITGTRTGTGNFLSLATASSNPVVSSQTETRSINSRPPTNMVYRFTPLNCIAPSITSLNNVTATSATFGWNEVVGVTGYEYAVSTSATPPPSGTATAANSVVVNLTAGVNNFFYVRSVCGDGVFSNWARRATVQCTNNLMPANGSVTSKTPTVSWNALPDATAYAIMFSEDGTNFTNIGSLDAPQTSATLTNLAYNTTYYFYVRPIIGSDTASVSCSTNATSFTVGDAPVLACVANILPLNAAKNISPADVEFKWNGVEGADGYVFMLSTDDGITYENLGWLTDTSVNLGGRRIINYATTYYYYVRPFIGEDTASVDCAVNATYFRTSAVPPVPVNDDCEGAIMLGFEAVDATTLGASEYMEADICNNAQGDANDDVWFKFTALSNGSATINLTNAANSLDAVIQAYSGTCGGFTLIGCADDTFDGGGESLTLNNLVQGTTYYFRVFGFYSSVDGGTFTVQLSGTVLPIHLVNFSGQKVANKNVLSWTTLSEQNSKGFELQRSADGNNFGSLHFENTKTRNGNSIVATNYQVVDEKPFSGNNYYRLKQVDRDGSFVLSNTVLIKGGKPTAFQISTVYPNPVTSKLQIVLAAPSSKAVTLVVMDITGKPVMRNAINVVQGDNNIQMNVSGLASGNYLVKVVCADGCQSAVQKFVKQ